MAAVRAHPLVQTLRLLACRAGFHWRQCSLALRRCQSAIPRLYPVRPPPLPIRHLPPRPTIAAALPYGFPSKFSKRIARTSRLTRHSLDGGFLCATSRTFCRCAFSPNTRSWPWLSCACVPARPCSCVTTGKNSRRTGRSCSRTFPLQRSSSHFSPISFAAFCSSSAWVPAGPLSTVSATSLSRGPSSRTSPSSPRAPAQITANSWSFISARSSPSSSPPGSPSPDRPLSQILISHQPSPLHDRADAHLQFRSSFLRHVSPTLTPC